MISTQNGQTQPALEVQEAPGADDYQAILAALVQFNRANGPETRAEPLAILIRDDLGEVAGGLWGKTIYDWLVVELVVVPESMRGRGVGARMIALAEQVARRRGCVGAWLDTFSFQARGFYERLGYRVVVDRSDHPIGGERYILAKRLG